MDKRSPQASTEEYSLQDNLGINRLNLEKGLRNRPNQYVLVDRGILLNPGKAYSDKMHQLDIAKKRDKLKKKIENRPDREELVRKLILQEESDCRKDEINRIKQLLDSSINTRPGSLELVDKNILQVDRLLASKVHNGDITYPKVCLEDIYYESNPVVPLPSIFEDIQTSPNDFPDILSQSSCKSVNNKSYKKTCRVGRFSFHNIEFRPAAQKAREFQQNELLEYEKIQAQHDPSLKRVHSELTMKSHKINDNKLEKWRSSKNSLLHRLNVHELKSECKLRMISCSNIPKVQLVEKLLPYEAEILRSHTNFDQSRNFQINKGDRRSIPIIPNVSDFSPPDLSTQMNLTPPPYLQTVESHFNGNVSNNRQTSKICHSISEPIIQDSNNLSESFSPIQFSVMNNHLVCYENIPSYNNYSSKNSYPFIYNNYNFPHQSCGSLYTNNYVQQQMKTKNVLLNPQPQMWETNEYNPVKIKSDSSIITQPMPSSEQFFNTTNNLNGSLNFAAYLPPSAMHESFNQSDVYTPIDAMVSSIPSTSVEKFNLISKQIIIYKNIVKRINHTKINKPNHIIEDTLLLEYNSVKAHLVNLIEEMLNFINMEVKFSRINQVTASIEKEWLFNLLQSINSVFNNKMSDIGSVNGLIVNNNDRICYTDDLDMEDFLIGDSNKVTNHSFNKALFMKNDELDAFWNNTNNDNELKTPETPLSEMCNSPMSTADFDHIMTSLFSVQDDTFLQS